MSEPVRIGVAGAGLTGRKHVELVRRSSDRVLAGIADSSPVAAWRRKIGGAPLLINPVHDLGNLRAREAARMGSRISPRQIVELAA